MKILILFLSLLLTWLPENVPFVNYSSGQDVCLEQVDGVEEEAVIRTSQTQEKQPCTSSEPIFGEFYPGLFPSGQHIPVPYCFKRQWLRTCTLRL